MTLCKDCPKTTKPKVGDWMHFVGVGRDDAFLVLGVSETQVVTYFEWNPATRKPFNWDIIDKFSISGFASSHTHKEYPW